MEQRTAILENAYYRNVLNVIEETLEKIPRPAHVDEKPGGKRITKYFFEEPVRTESLENQQGRVTITYSKTTRTQYAILAGIITEKEPIVFECSQGKENNTVEVRAYCSTNKESADWIESIFGNIWKQLLHFFSD